MILISIFIKKHDQIVPKKARLIWAHLQSPTWRAEVGELWIWSQTEIRKYTNIIIHHTERLKKGGKNPTISLWREKKSQCEAPLHIFQEGAFLAGKAAFKHLVKHHSDISTSCLKSKTKTPTVIASSSWCWSLGQCNGEKCKDWKGRKYILLSAHH